MPGFERAYLAQSGVHAGVRETPRIRGDYRLTADDVLSARQFDDVIGRGSYPVDIHNPKGSGTVLKRLPDGAARTRAPGAATTRTTDPRSGERTSAI